MLLAFSIIINVSAVVTGMHVEAVDHVPVDGNTAYAILHRIGLERNSSPTSLTSLQQAPLYENVQLVISQ